MISPMLGFELADPAHSESYLGSFGFVQLFAVARCADLFQGERRRSEATSAKIPLERLIPPLHQRGGAWAR